MRLMLLTIAAYNNAVRAGGMTRGTADEFIRRLLADHNEGIREQCKGGTK